ncbi:MAG: type II secretion system protein N [Endozoicomonas sp.]|uniref:type II secretion system protein N n=1 Tax=Endozoicomonas sp. TaxID=1892382 RepID=UPI003D9B0A9E
MMYFAHIAKKQSLKNTVWLLLIVLVCVALLVSVAYQLRVNWVLASHETSVVVSGSLASNELIQDELLTVGEMDLQLFGVYQPSEHIKPVQVLSTLAPVTTFSYTLEAIYFSTQRSLSAISIASEQKNGFYREADELAPGVTIKQINQDKVILSRNGQQEQLLLNPDPLETVLTKPTILMPSQLDLIQSKSVNKTKNDLQTRLQRLRDRLDKTSS